jgi:hypothetical protein
MAIEASLAPDARKYKFYIIAVLFVFLSLSEILNK